MATTWRIPVHNDEPKTTHNFEEVKIFLASQAKLNPFLGRASRKIKSVEKQPVGSAQSAR